MAIQQCVGILGGMRSRLTAVGGMFMSTVVYPLIKFVVQPDDGQYARLKHVVVCTIYRIIILSCVLTIYLTLR